MKTYEECINELTPDPDEVNFKVDVMQQQILKRIAMSDDNIKYTMNTDFTPLFSQYINDKLEAKEQIKINVKGETRSGKSLIALTIANMVVNFYNNKTEIKKVFDTEKIVCANQKELRQKINVAEFGDVFQVDEHAFASMGEGSFAEALQLMDLNNKIAVENIHMIFITPQKFLLNGATTGLSYYGKDTNNWLSRFLCFVIQQKPELVGYVVFDVGKLFWSNGCLIYKQLGGCRNPRRVTFDKIDTDFLNYTSCVDHNKFNTIDHNFTKRCPLYEICNHPLNQYEKKKDRWVSKDMHGGTDERKRERYEIALTLFKMLARIKDNGEIILISEKTKKTEIDDVIHLKINSLSNTIWTGTEVQMINNSIFSMRNLIHLQDVCKVLELDVKDVLTEILNKPPEDNINAFDLLGIPLKKEKLINNEINKDLGGFK